MVLEYEEFTVRNILAGLAANGFKHIRGNWGAEDQKGISTGGCVLQQGAFNLGVYAQNEEEDYDVIPVKKNTLYDQLNRFQIPLTSKWYIGAYDRGAGTVITYWNDHESNILNKDGTVSIDKYGSIRTTYTLKTYEDVIEMATEVLTPHLDKTVKLAKKQWKFRRKKGATPFVLEGAHA